MSGPSAPDRAPGKWSVPTLIALALLSALFVGLSWAGRQPGITSGNDDARYMLLARSLRAGTYRDLYLVGQHWHSLYPPGYPALLAFFGGLFGESHDLFIVLNIALALGTIVLVADVARRLWSTELAIAVFVLCVFSFSLVLDITTWVMSEGMYMTVCAVALWAAADRSGSTRRVWLAGAAACLAALTRSVGVTLIGGLFLAWLVERRWKAAGGLALGASLTVGPWLAWTVLAPVQYVGRSYVADARGGAGAGGPGLAVPMLTRISANAYQYALRDIPDSLALPTIVGTSLDNWFFLAVWAGLGTIGCLALWRKWKALLGYTLCYFGLLLIWPYHQIRFLAPFFPFFLFIVGVGAWELGRRVSERRPWMPLAAVTALFSTIGLMGQLRYDARMRACDRSVDPPTLGCVSADVASFVEAARFARSLPPGSAFAVGKDASFAYISGQPVVPAAALMREPPESFRARMAEVGVQYLFIGRVAGEDAYLAEAVLPLCQDMVVVRSFGPYTFLLRPAGEGEADPSRGTACEALDEIASVRRAGHSER